MATGGFVGEEELCSFELFKCSVCLEHLINKQPRLLSCGHTFCTPCLQQLYEGETIKCPKCRSLTRLPPGGVQAVPKNIDVTKVWEREQELSARIEHFCQMCRKKEAKVEFFCTGCPKGHICKGCNNKHKTIPSLKAHNIFPKEKKPATNKDYEMCKYHDNLLEHFCKQCEEAICMTCICDPQHEQHCDQIVDFRIGLKELKASMNKLHKEFKDNAKKVEECAKVLKKDMASLKESKEELCDKCKDVETIHNKMKEQLDHLTELEYPVINASREIETHLADIQKQITELKTLNRSSDVEFIQRAKECRSNCNHIIKDTQKVLNKKILIPDNIKHNIKIVGEVVQIETKEVTLKDNVKRSGTQEFKFDVRNAEITHTLDNLRLITEIEPAVVMENPLEVVNVGDGTVILVDKKLNFLQRINTEGKVLKKYQVQFKGQQAYYRSACVYGNYLFAATSDNVITKMSLDDSGCNIEYKPERVGTIRYITAIGDNVILISGGEWNGTISEYNTETNKVIQRVTGIKSPGKVIVAQTFFDQKYIIQCHKSYNHVMTNQCTRTCILNIYNSDWCLISTLAMCSDLLTVTPAGKLLTVYNNRFHENSQDGKQPRELTGNYQLNHVKDISCVDVQHHCRACYLCILEIHPHCIKIFQLQ